MKPPATASEPQGKAVHPEPVAAGVAGGPAEAAQSAAVNDSASREVTQTATSGTSEVPLVAVEEAPQSKEGATNKPERRSGGKPGPPTGRRHRGHPPFRMKGIEWRFIGRYWYALSREWIHDPRTGKKKRKRKYLGRLDK